MGPRANRVASGQASKPVGTVYTRILVKAIWKPLMRGHLAAWDPAEEQEYEERIHAVEGATATDISALADVVAQRSGAARSVVMLDWMYYECHPSRDPHHWQEGAVHFRERPRG